MSAESNAVSYDTHRGRHTNIAGLLLEAVQRCPRSGFHFADHTSRSEFLSYPMLCEEARCILGELRSQVPIKGSKIALVLDRPRDFLPAFWACVLGGYIPCPVAPIRNDADRWAKHLAHVDALLEHPLLVTTRTMKAELSIPTSVDLDDLRSGIRCESTHTAGLGEPAVLMLTSGSTGNAKAVELTHGNLLSSMAGKAESQELSASDVALNWIAFDHVAALLEVHMIAQYVGATQIHVEPAVVLTDSLQFLRLIDRHRVSLAFAPNFLLGQINAAIKSRSLGSSRDGALSLDLSCLRYIVTGGEANLVETGRQFLELLGPCGLAGNALRPAFGMTETSAASVYSSEFPPCDQAHEFAAVGCPIREFELRILADDCTLAPPGTSGELQVRGPMVFRRYYRNEEATRAAFTSDGWFRTGDLGCIDEGRLRLVGRSKDCIIVSGVNYFSHELEATLETLDGIERSYIAAFPTRPKGADTEQLVVAFATSFALDDEVRLYQLALAVRNTTILLWGFRPALLLPLPKTAFPKTSLGKIQRSTMRKSLESGHFAAHEAHLALITSRQAGAYVAPDGSEEASVAGFYAEILGLDPATISATASFFELGGTSLDILKLTRTLSRHFGVQVPLTAVLQAPTVRGLATYIQSEMRQETRVYDPLVPLQLTGEKMPLFCVHPGNGGVLIFANLAKYFANERPFYALRPRGFNRGERCFETFDELIDAYLTAIRKRQPHGPYALAGYSVGCPIVFEMARRLESRGERVAFLGCIDEGPSEDWPETRLGGSAVALSMVLGLIDREKSLALGKELDSRDISAPCEYVFQFAAPQRVHELDLDLPKFSAWATIAQSNHTLVRAAHVTSGSVDSMTVFCSAGWPLDMPVEMWQAHLRRWDHYSRRPNKYVDVAGDHMQLMDPKHVASFQATFRAEIAYSMEGR